VIRTCQFCILAITAIASAPSASAATLFSGLYTFGDSLSDTGNTSVGTGGLFPGPGYDDGRYSNGPLWVEYLAARLGLPDITPSLSGGTGHAFAGATTAANALPPSMRAQAQNFIDTGGTFLPTDLVIVWGGANDFFDNPAPNPLASAANIGNIVTTLAGGGARNFLILNLPDLGDTPESVATENPLVIAALNQVTVTFNTALASLVPTLASNLGIDIRFLDAFAIGKAMKNNPATYGFTNTTLGALPSGNAASADGFLYWDNTHPTTRAHEVFADAAFAIIPEPSSATLVCLFAAGTLLRRKRPALAA
jgi:phospholipase/lecithinase/hemolysin